MEDREYRVKVVEAGVAVIGLVSLVFGGWMAYLSFRQNAELQALRALNEAKLQMCQSIVDLASKMYSAADVHTLRSTYTSFAEIKHGKGLILLDQEVLDQAIAVHKAALEALALEDGPDFAERARCKLGNEPLKLAVSCRTMMGAALATESGAAITPLVPRYAMQWIKSCPKQ